MRLLSWRNSTLFLFFVVVLLVSLRFPDAQAQGTIPSPAVYLPLIIHVIPTPTLNEPPIAPSPTPTQTSIRFTKAVVRQCVRQSAGNWFDGMVYVNHEPANGFRVVFSDTSDGTPITSPVISGPHCEYPGWRTGYYSHIIHASGPQPGDWYVWIVNDGGQRISEIAHWHSTGPGEDCNQATVDFDTN